MEAFEELNVWQQARVIRTQVSELVKRLPDDEKYRLANQLIRSSRSVTANIAEGFGRFHHQENIQFCRPARGARTEPIAYLKRAKDSRNDNE